MVEDKMMWKGKGFVWELILQGGGVRNFLWFTLIIGIICVLFSWINSSLIPLALFAIVTISTLLLMCYLLKTPEGRLLFLDSNTYFKIIRMQMGLMSDKSGSKQIGPKTQFVQPVLETQGDVVTEAKLDTEKVIEAKL